MRRNIKPLFFRFGLTIYQKRYFNSGSSCFQDKSFKDGIVRFNYKNFLELSNKNIYSHFQKDLDQGNIAFLKEPVAFKKDNKLIAHVWIKHLASLAIYEKVKLTFVIENLTS